MEIHEIWWLVDAVTPKEAKQSLSDKDELLTMLREAKQKEAVSR